MMGSLLGALGDEYSKSPCRDESPRLLKDKPQLPSLQGDLLAELRLPEGPPSG